MAAERDGNILLARSIRTANNLGYSGSTERLKLRHWLAIDVEPIVLERRLPPTDEDLILTAVAMAVIEAIWVERMNPTAFGCRVGAAEINGKVGTRWGVWHG
jgi:predicted outer membrane lipoprotein